MVSALIPLGIKLLMWFLRSSRQSKVHKLEAEKAALRQDKKILELRLVRERLARELAVAEKEKELAVHKETTRAAARKKQLYAKHNVEHWSDEDVDAYLKTKNIL